jgi:hypothetical protein
MGRREPVKHRDHVAPERLGPHQRAELLPSPFGQRRDARVSGGSQFFHGDVAGRLGVELGELLDHLRLEPELFGERGGGLAGSAQRARDDVVEVLALQPLGQAGGLLPTFVGEGGVGDAHL